MTCQLWWYCQNRNHLCITTIWQTFWRIPWRYSRATCHTAGCCHLANSMIWSQSYVSHCRVLQYIIIHLPYWKSFFAMFYFFVFFNAVWALTSGGFRIVSDSLVISYFGFRFNNAYKYILFCSLWCDRRGYKQSWRLLLSTNINFVCITRR